MARQAAGLNGIIHTSALAAITPARSLVLITQSDNWSQLDFVHRIYRLIWELYLFLKELTGFQGKHRKLWNLCLKALDLTMQYFMLSGLLEAGTPVELIFGFAVFTALNSLFCAIEIINHRFTAFAEILIDSLFDLCAAVLFPIVVLVYSANNFDFDRAVFHINMELLPVGSFERRARMFASPTEIELFRVSFDSLRIRTVADYFLRIGMNLGFSYRFKRVVEVLIQMQNQRQRLQSSRRASLARQYSNLLKFSKFPSGQRSCQRTAPKSLAILHLAYSVGVIVVTHRSISTSQAVCSSYPECAVFAYRWRDTGLCPCLALIDGNRAPKTYFEWTHPVDATDTVKALAAAGTLETLQLINRQLTVLPDELRGCHNLNYISLINCAVEELPIWAKGFRKLQYLQIEGKVGNDNLGNLADDLFSDMPELRYLQLGLHQRMVRLPPLDGVPNLSCLVLARMKNITSSGYTRIADQSPMTSAACPWACPSAPTLLSDCGISSTSSSSLYLAAETRRRRRLQAENETETCSGVAVVDATSLSGLGVQAAELTNTTLTELNLTDNNIADVRDLQLPETLQQLYLSRNKLTSLEIPESWRHLEVLNVSDNPIANFTVEGKDGPRVLIARNTSFSSMEDVVFPATLRQLDVSLTPIANWGNFTPPTDLSDLTAQDSSIELLGPANFSACDRSFTMDFSGNNITTIRGVRFPPNLRTLFLNGSSVTQFEVCKSDVKVLERLEAFNVTTLTLADESCSDATIPTSVIIANTSYSLCVLTDAAFDEKYKGGKVSSSTSLTTLLLLLFSIASAVSVLLMLFAIKRKIIDERRAKAARAEKLKAEHAASEGSSDDEESDKMKMSSAMLTDDVRSDPDFERYRIPQNDLEVVKQLAKGAGGVVHLAKWKPKKEQVVVKRVAPEKSKSVRELQRFTREIRLYGNLKHPKIVAFRGIAWSSLADLSLVLEYMPNGDLAQFLERQQMLDSQRRGWSWLTDEDSGFKHSKLTMALDVADALVYLHSFAEPIMHRDLKAQNILLSNKWVAKISDFGVSKRCEQRNEQQGVSSGGPQTAEVGTAAWIAPEVIKGARYDQKADIYSFGVVMCELDTCTRPYALGVASSHSASGMTSFTSASQASDDEEVKSLLSSNATLALAVSEKGVMPAFHSDCPRAILDLARMCLSYDPEDRPTAKELWRLLQDLAAPGALLTSSRKATLTESLRHVSTSA
ncbi:hypothetical protein PI125_g5913 [Phytophthora idaei]|nr:hypothetical protein PI125_g5913 [Phytophthora idaei]